MSGRAGAGHGSSTAAGLSSILYPMTSAQQSTEADTEKEDPPPLLPGCHDPTPSNWSLQIGHLEHARSGLISISCWIHFTNHSYISTAILTLICLMKGRLFGIMKIKLVLVMKSQQGESHSRDFPHSKDEKCHIVIVFKYPIRPEGRCNEQQDVNI